MSKLNPPERRDPPRFADLTEHEVAQLQLLKAGAERPDVMWAGKIGSIKLLESRGLKLDRRTVLLRSFRNV